MPKKRKKANKGNYAKARLKPWYRRIIVPSTIWGVFMFASLVLTNSERMDLILSGSVGWPELVALVAIFVAISLCVGAGYDWLDRREQKEP